VSLISVNPQGFLSRPTKVVPKLPRVSEPVKNAGTVNPTQNEIATVAYQLWLEGGCPIGSDQEHWFRAETMLKGAPVAKREDLSRGPSIPGRDTRTESEMVAELTLGRWEGHWEIWEQEWPGAQWVWDARDSGVRVSNHAA
jgi:hypothetical protein